MKKNAITVLLIVFGAIAVNTFVRPHIGTKPEPSQTQVDTNVPLAVRQITNVGQNTTGRGPELHAVSAAERLALRKCLAQEDALIQKYHNLLTTEFLARGTLTYDKSSQTVEVRVPGDPKRARELRAAFFDEVIELESPTLGDGLLDNIDRMLGLDAQLNYFGDTPIVFHFQAKEGFPGDPKIVTFKEDFGTYWGTGSMDPGPFRTSFGALGEAVLKKLMSTDKMGSPVERQGESTAAAR